MTPENWGSELTVGKRVGNTLQIGAGVSARQSRNDCAGLKGATGSWTADSGGEDG